MKESELRTAFLISGGGSTAESVIQAIQTGRLTGIDPVAVISSSPHAAGIAKAQALGISTFIISPRSISREEFGVELLSQLQNLGVDLVSQNGWLPLTPEIVVSEYQERIINQHPGPLDPGRGNDFGGKGMYGRRVNAARIGYCWSVGDEAPWTEATTHFVTPEYDQGMLIRVERLAFAPFGKEVTIAALRNDSQRLIQATEMLAAELLPLEHENVIATLKMFADGQVAGFQREEPLIPPGSERVLFDAKELAGEVFRHG